MIAAVLLASCGAQAPAAPTPAAPAEAPNPNCAYRWLEWSINPRLQGDLAAWFGSVPSVLAACEGNEPLGAEGCKTNGLDNFAAAARDTHGMRAGEFAAGCTVVLKPAPSTPITTLLLAELSAEASRPAAARAAELAARAHPPAGRIGEPACGRYPFPAHPPLIGPPAE